MQKQLCDSWSCTPGRQDCGYVQSRKVLLDGDTSRAVCAVLGEGGSCIICSQSLQKIHGTEARLTLPARVSWCCSADSSTAPAELGPSPSITTFVWLGFFCLFVFCFYWTV